MKIITFFIPKRHKSRCLDVSQTRLSENSLIGTSRQAAQLSFIFLQVFLWGSFSANVFAGDMAPEVCLTCHMQTVEQDSSKQYLHRPFTLEKCTVCHLGEDDSVQNEPSVDRQYAPVVSWIGVYSSPDVSHALKLSRMEPGRSLIIEADLPKLPPYKMQVVVPEIRTMSPASNDGKPPVLKEILVDEIKRSVLISAVISWKTDELANSTIRYGTSKTDKSFHDNGHFSKNHEIILSGLLPNTIYTFEVISEDFFGNTTTSPPQTFSTKRFFSDVEGPVKREPAEVFITHSFLKIDDDTMMLELSANTPVTISIGYDPSSQLAPSAISPSSGVVSLPEEHVQLAGKEWTGISSCYTCHEAVKGPMSHPVNVRPRAGMVIPPEYPTLPDGRISCMSCHANHGSNLEYRLLKPSKRELCVGCHRDMK